jgi:hypothetical protein
MISRRDVIRNLVISVGGTSLLSACGGRVTLDTLTPAATPRFYGERDMALLSRVSDLILPRTETPGALDVQVPSLLDELMTVWADSETQQSHRAALASLDVALRTQAGGDFLEATDAVAERALTAVDAAAFAADPAELSEARGVASAGYRRLKGLIAQVYFTTEAGAVEEQGWVAVPGRWDPCADR